jgi:hypothetical protein
MQPVETATATGGTHGLGERGADVVALRDMGFGHVGDDTLIGAVAVTHNLEEAIELLVALSAPKSGDCAGQKSFTLEDEAWPVLGGQVCHRTTKTRESSGDAGSEGGRLDAGNIEHAHGTREGADGAGSREKRKRENGFTWIESEEKEEEDGWENVHAEDEEWLDVGGEGMLSGDEEGDDGDDDGDGDGDGDGAEDMDHK